jgi:hypothetical protein
MIKKFASLAIVLVLMLPALTMPETISMMMGRQLKQGGDDDLNIPAFNAPLKEHGKSKFKALGLSLLIPGAGQYYTGNKTKMTIFAGTEALIWTSFFGLRAYGSWKKNDYKGWAAIHSGAKINGKSDFFFEKLTYYDNLNEYNQLAPLYDGAQAQLFPSTPDYWWNWDSQANQDHYRALRNQSKNAYRRSLFLVAGALLNRILSGIDAYRSASSLDRNKEFGAADWGLYYSADGPLWDSKLEMGFVKKF